MPSVEFSMVIEPWKPKPKFKGYAKILPILKLLHMPERNGTYL